MRNKERGCLPSSVSFKFKSRSWKSIPYNYFSNGVKGFWGFGERIINAKKIVGRFGNNHARLSGGKGGGFVDDEMLMMTVTISRRR